MPLFLDLVRDDPPVGSTGFFGEPAQVVHRHRHFALALSERLAVLQRNQPGNFFPAPVQLVAYLVEQFATAFARKLTPGLKGRVRVLNGLGHSRPID